MAISMLKIRRPLGRLIFNMGIAIPGKTVFLIETAPWGQAHVILKIHALSASVPSRCQQIYIFGSESSCWVKHTWDIYEIKEMAYRLLFET